MAMARDIRDLLSYRLAALAGLNDRSGHMHLKEAFGLTLSEWRVFGNIAARSPLTPVELARSLNIDRGQLSRTMAELVRRGWVATEPLPGDRRTLVLTLTPKGRTEHRRVLRFADARNRALLSVLKAEERRSLDLILQKLAVFLEAEFAALDRGSARKAEIVARRLSLARQS